jgi:hypothetical protein
VWLTLALCTASTAVGLAVADVAASILVAWLGVPIGAYAAIAQLSRVGVAASLSAIAIDLGVLGYWAVVFLDALEGVR